MKLSVALISIFLIVGLTTALPQTGGGGSGTEDDIPCPLVGPCYDINTITGYCANNTDPAILSGDTFDSTDAIECVCGSDVLGDENGLYSALECITCAKSLDDDDTAWLALWAYTCYTAGEDGLDAAVDCWNSGGEKGCTPLPDSETKKMKLLTKKGKKLRL